jgi:hypothetical protein
MSIRFRCKKCNQKYELDDDFAGDTLECGKCDTQMLVPQESEIPPKASANQTTAPSTELNADPGHDQQPDNASTDAEPDDNVIVWCKACGQKYNLSKDLAGREGECAKCKKVFKVPVETEARLSGMMSLLKQELLEKRNAPAKKPSPVEVEPVPASEPVAAAGAESATSELVAEPASEPQKPKITLKYLLSMPKRTLLFGGFSLIIDALMQHKLLHKMHRRVVMVLFLSTILLSMLIIVGGIKIYQIKAKSVLKINVMCADCSLCEARPIKNIFTEKCSKCKGQLGFQWKCGYCNKIFTRIERKSADTPIQYDKINTLTPPVCPFCGSTAVKYYSK